MLNREKLKAITMLSLSNTPQSKSLWRGYRVGLTVTKGKDFEERCKESLHSPDKCRSLYSLGYLMGSVKREILNQEEE